MDFPSVISQVTVRGGFPVGRAVGSPLGGRMGRYPVIPVVDPFRQAGVATHSGCMQRKTISKPFSSSWEVDLLISFGKTLQGTSVCTDTYSRGAS